MADSNPPEKGDQYRYADGTTEVVFSTDDGRVLTFREYRDAEAFERAVADADRDGVNDRVRELPGAEAFRDLDI